MTNKYHHMHHHLFSLGMRERVLAVWLHCTASSSKRSLRMLQLRVLLIICTLSDFRSFFCFFFHKNNSSIYNTHSQYCIIIISYFYDLLFFPYMHKHSLSGFCGFFSF